MARQIKVPVVQSATHDNGTDETLQNEVGGNADPKGDGVIDPPVEDDAGDFVADAFEAFSGNIAPEDEEEIGIEDVGKKPAKKAASGEEEPDEEGDEPSEEESDKEVTKPAAAAAQTTETVVPGQPNPQAVTPQQGQPQPAQSPQQAVPPEQVLSNLANEVEKGREEFVKVASKSYYDTFTDADIEQFQEDPRSALSSMAARLHADIVSNTLRMVGAHLPRMVHGLASARAEHESAETKFFSENADLVAVKDKLAPIAQAIRAARPDASSEEFSAMLAASARQAFKIAPAQAAPKTPAAPQKVRQQPFQPAGGTPRQAQTPQRKAVPKGQTDWGTMSEVVDAAEAGSFDGVFRD